MRELISNILKKLDISNPEGILKERTVVVEKKFSE
jgi:hypothetical protein